MGYCEFKLTQYPATLLFETKQPRPMERPHSITLSFYREEEQWALLQFQLFTHRDLWAWLDEPFTGPPVIEEAEQLVLAEIA